MHYTHFLFVISLNVDSGGHTLIQILLSKNKGMSQDVQVIFELQVLHVDIQSLQVLFYEV